MNPCINQTDVAMRLNGVIGMFRGTPVMISVNKNDELHHITILSIENPDTHRMRIDSLHPDLELNIFNLGYCNVSQNKRSEALWISRSPKRNTKQGICFDSLYVNGRICDTSFALQAALAKMLKNEYPDFETARARLKLKAVEGVAFHRNYALSRVDEYEIGLFRQGRLIAHPSESDPYVFHLLPKFVKLKPMLMEELTKTGVKLI